MEEYLKIGFAIAITVNVLFFVCLINNVKHNNSKNQSDESN